MHAGNVLTTDERDYVLNDVSMQQQSRVVMPATSSLISPQLGQANYALVASSNGGLQPVTLSAQQMISGEWLVDRILLLSRYHFV